MTCSWAFVRAMLFCLALLSVHPLRGIDRNWTGAASNHRWSTASNWNPAGAPQNGDSLTLRDYSTNDLIGLNLHSIQSFSIGNCSIYGNGLSLSSGIHSAQDVHLRVHCQITLSANQEFRLLNALSADLLLTGGLNLNGFDLALNLYSRFGTLALSNVISGTGNITVREDFSAEYSRVELGAPGIINTFNGMVTLNSGILKLLGSEPLGTDGVVLNGGTLLFEDATTARPLRFGQTFAMTALGFSQWNGPIYLHEDPPQGGTVPLTYISSSNRFVISGPISGPTNGLLRFFGRVVELSGSAVDTFTGALDAGCELLLLNKSGGTRLGARELAISVQSEVRWLANNQLAGANVTFGGISSLPNLNLLNLNGFSDTVGSITSFGGTIATATGELTMNGPLTQKGGPFADRLFIEGNLRLPSGFRTVDVEPPNPSRINDVVISAKVHGPASLQKTGGGTLWLTGANDYTGLTLISEGTLVAGASGALGTTSSGTIVADGATLSLSSVGGTLGELISLRGAGVGGTNGALNVQSTLSVTLRNPTPSIFACLDLVTNATIRVGTSARLIADGFISGIGPLTKTGPGLLIFINANSNTYSGDTIVAEGLLELRKPNSALAMSGNLILGPAPSGGTAVVRLYQNAGLPANAIVTANAGALFDLNGMNQVLAGLNLNDGGGVQTGAGQLFFGATAFVRVGSLSPAGSFAGSSISGNLRLSPSRTLGFDVRAFASSASATGPELDVPASITVDPREDPDLGLAGLNKTGSGRMRLSGNNIHRGYTIVSDGTLEVAGTQIYSTVAVQSGARLRGAGTVGRLFVDNGATVAPGASLGTLTCSNFNAGGGRGTLEMELQGITPGTGYDRLNVQGSVRLTGMSLSASLGFASAIGNQFTIIANDGTDAVVDTFTGLPQNAKFHVGGQQFTISYTGGTGNDVVLTRLTTPPQPLLVIQRVPPNSVRLLWPTNGAGYFLQSHTNVADTNWSPALPPPFVAGTNHVVTNAVTNLNFYRLSAP